MSTESGVTPQPGALLGQVASTKLTVSRVTSVPDWARVVTARPTSAAPPLQQVAEARARPEQKERQTAEQHRQRL